MPTFGKRQGGGRRANARAAAPLPAMVTTLDTSKAVALVDISPTGAQLRGSDLPQRGGNLLIKIDRVQLFATVVWSKENQCGIEFEVAIPNWQLEHLRRDAGTARMMRLSPEEKLALDDWNIGLAR